VPAAAVGQRYLLVDDISQQRVYTTGTVTAWQGLTRGARANDIIQYGSSTYSVFTSGTQALGATTLTLDDVGDIDIGYQVKDKVSGTLLGLVVVVLYDSNQVIIDTATTAAISNGVELSIVGTGWYVAYTPGSSVEYVTNTTSGIQYRINNGVWRKSYDGYYPQGDWRIVI
jgi:hypothetical protein